MLPMVVPSMLQSGSDELRRRHHVLAYLGGPGGAARDTNRGMEIVVAGEADIDGAVSLWKREGGPTSLPGGRVQAAALLRRDPGALLLARDNGTLIGTVIVGWDGWRCHLYRLVVEPAWRRRGVASRLIAEAERRAHSLGAPKIDALVAFDNVSAITFWEGVGFEQDPRDGRWSQVTP